MLTTVILATALWTASAEKLVVPPVSNKFADLFEAREFRYTGGQYRQELFKYRLFVPRRLQPGERCPLIVWLHGFNERGSDNQFNLAWLHLILKDPKHVEQYRFFILAVQCPEKNGSWYRRWAREDSPGDAADDMLSVLHQILAKTLREQPIDADRVYLTGVSSGGSGCWEMALRYPELFAAVATMSSGGGDVSRAAQLKDIPIWAFHNRRDTGVPPDGDAAMVEAVNEAGGNACLTLEEASGHNSWSVAFRKYDALGWMLSQRRGEPCWNPPGPSHAKWYVLGIVGLVAAVGTVRWYLQRRATL